MTVTTAQSATSAPPANRGNGAARVVVLGPAVLAAYPNRVREAIHRAAPLTVVEADIPAVASMTAVPDYPAGGAHPEENPAARVDGGPPVPKECTVMVVTVAARRRQAVGMARPDPMVVWELLVVEAEEEAVAGEVMTGAGNMVGQAAAAAAGAAVVLEVLAAVAAAALSAFS